MRRKLGSVAGTLPLVLAGALLASTAASLAREPRDVLHVVVTTDAASEGMFVSEMWLDEARMLGLALDMHAGETARSASGPNWLLDIPAGSDRPALRYVYDQGIAPTGVLQRLWYFRMELQAGRASVLEERPLTRLVRDESGNTAELLREDDLPVWQRVEGRTTSYEYLLRERLPTSAFPVEFFADEPGRPTVTTFETDWPGVLRRATFHPRSAGPEVVGRELRTVLYRHDPEGRTTEQVHLLYGNDVQVVTSKLRTPPTSARPDGEKVTTSIGEGLLYRDQDRAYLMVLDGLTVTTVFGPDSAVVLSVASRLSR